MAISELRHREDDAMPPIAAASTLMEDPCDTVQVGKTNEDSDDDDDVVDQLEDKDIMAPLQGVSSDTHHANEDATSFHALLTQFTSYRWFLVSYIVTNCGVWFTYVASLALLEQHAHRRTAAATSAMETASSVTTSPLVISTLVLVRLVACTVWMPQGGVWADTHDRRHVMLWLDVCGAVVAVSFLLAQHSVAVLFVITAVQESLTGLYEPSRSAILPQLVPAAYIPKANTLAALVWSTTQALGSSLGGFIVAKFGVPACFLVDASLYAISAMMLTRLEGCYSVVHGNAINRSSTETADSRLGKPEQREATETSSQSMSGAFSYLATSPNGVFIWIKGCGAFLFGASDVISVVLSHDSNGRLDSERLGWLFAAVGVGCLAGPVLIPQKRDWLKACIYSYVVIGVGYILIGMAPLFWQKCVFNSVRAAGTAVLWIDSTTLLQTTTPETLMGRVMAVDLGLATLSEAVSAMGAGILLDCDMTANGIAILLGAVGLGFAALWGVWLMRRRHSSAMQEESHQDKPARGIELEALNV